MALSTKQQAFIEHYLTLWNGYRAAIAAGYSETSARHQASRMLSNDNIQAAIQERLAELKMGADEVLARLTAQARGSMGDFLRTDEEEITLTWSLLSLPTTEDGEVDMAGAMLRLAGQENVQPTDRILHTATIKRAVARLDLLAAERHLHLIKKYSLDDKGKVSIELYDAQAALTLLGRHHKLFVDRTEHTGVDGAPIAIQFTQALDTAYADTPDTADDPE
jgi:phage terminase small subunit